MKFPVALLLFALAPLASSATIYVPDSYSTIQDAIAASASGDMIVVRAGTYTENIDFLGKAITVRSESGTAATVIDGNQWGPVVQFANGEGAASVLEGFTVRNGLNGVVCDSSSPTIIGNLVTANSDPSGYGAGAISCYVGADAHIVDNVITDNTMRYGGGIYCNYCSPRIESNIITDNVATMFGGGICCDRYNLSSITENEITGNSAGVGAGIYCGLGSQPVIAANAIRKNTASSDGGGIGCHQSSTTGGAFKIDGNVIAENSARRGGGIWWKDTGTVAITGNSISANFANEFGGGLCLISTISSSQLVTVARNTFTWNSSLQDGGAIFSYDTSPTISGNMIERNSSSDEGAGIGLRFDDAVITNNTITGNIADYLGGGLNCYFSSPTVTNTILWNNWAPRGPEVCLVSGSGKPTLAFCNVRGGWAGTGNIAADPRFVDPSNGDFHLTWNSPCRDSGDGGSAIDSNDFEGDPRIALGTVDMGADEFHYHLYHTRDVIPGLDCDVKVVGYPTAPVTLFLGTGLAEPPLSTPHGTFYLNLPVHFQTSLQAIPGNGVREVTVKIPSSWTSGSLHYAQALVGPVGGSLTRLTNLMTLVAR